MREALEVAIRELKAKNSNVEDADRPDSGQILPEELHLDHDRKGITGSPDLVAVIINKIRQSAIFIADITPIAKTTEGKDVMNPNVAIELGIALEAIGSEKVLLVLNSAYGKRESMPFDLRHKAGPIMYELHAEAKASEIDVEKRKLINFLKITIEPLLINEENHTPAYVSFDPGPNWETRSTFVVDDQMDIISAGLMGGTQKSIVTPKDAALFLRAYPMNTIPEYPIDEIQKMVSEGTAITPFYYENAFDRGRDPEGIITYALFNDVARPCSDYVKVFSTGQIWAVFHYSQAMIRPDDGGILLALLMNRLAFKFRQYRLFINEKFKYKGEVGYIVGIAGLKGLRVGGSRRGFPILEGQGFKPNVELKGHCLAEQSEADALYPFVTKVWESFGLSPLSINIQEI